MSAIAVLAGLSKAFGPVLAQGVLERLMKVKGATSKIQRALDATEKGVSVIAALRGEFGDAFLKAVADAVGRTPEATWSYEAGIQDYIKLAPEDTDPANVISCLRDELNINLDRLSITGNNSDGHLTNYFRGVLGVWKKRFAEFLGEDDDANTTFDAIDKLLHGRDRSFKDVLEILTKTSLGGSGALMVIIGVMLATSTGVGVVTMISTFMLGIPWISVGALVIPGAILVTLSRYKFNDKHKLTACIALAYKLLERRHKAIDLPGNPPVSRSFQK